MGRFAREFKQVGSKEETVREGYGCKCVEGFRQQLGGCLEREVFLPGETMYIPTTFNSSEREPSGEV